MKVIELQQMKSVQYHGIEVHVPVHIQFIATDKDGTTIGFEKRPVPDFELGWWDNPTGDDMYDVGVFDLEGSDWMKTLVEV